MKSTRETAVGDRLYSWLFEMRYGSMDGVKPVSASISGIPEIPGVSGVSGVSRDLMDGRGGTRRLGWTWMDEEGGRTIPTLLVVFSGHHRRGHRVVPLFAYRRRR